VHATDQRLAAYLAGELDPDAARAVDEHLLACDRCWRTVSAARFGRRAAERLRQPTPPALADRIRLAIQLAPNAAPPRRSRTRRGRWTATAAGTAALIGAIVLAALLVPQHTARHDPPVISALVHLAAPPATTPTPGPTADASPVTTQVGGQVVVLRRYPVDGGMALVATSTQAFPTPPGAQIHPDRSMAWTITRATVTVYCPHPKVILAGRLPASTLVVLAAHLHLD
jgi:hypothetical protein